MQRLLLLIVILMLGVLNVAAQDDEEASFLPDDLQPITINNVLDVERLGTLRYGDPISVQWSGDGATIAVLTTAAIYVFDADDLSVPLATLAVDAPLGGMAYKADGDYIIAYDGDDNYLIWNLTSGQAEFGGRTHMPFPPDLIAYTTAGARILVGTNDNGLTYFDRTNERLLTIDADTGRGTLALSADGTRLAKYRWDDGTINVWDTDANALLQVISTESSGPIYDLAFSPDNAQLALTTVASQVSVWEIETGAITATYPTEIIDVPTVDWSADGTMLVAGTANPFGEAGNYVYLWATDTPDAPTILRGHSGQVIDVAFSPDAETVASLSGDSTLRLWSVADGRLIAQTDGFFRAVDDVSLNADASLLAVADDDIQLWDMATGTRISTLAESKVTRLLAFLPEGDGDLLGAGTVSITESPVRRWSPAGELINAAFVPHQEGVSALARSADGSTLVSSSVDGTRIASVASGETVTVLVGVSVAAAALNSDGSDIALATFAGDLILLDRDGNEVNRLSLADFSRVIDLTFSPDGTSLLVATEDDGMVLLNAATLETIWTNPHHARDSVYSGDGDEVVILSVGRDGLLAISPEVGVYILVLDYNPGIRALSLSADGTQLVGGSSDGRVYIWGVPGENSD